MPIRINFDPAHNPEPPTLVLSTRNGTKLGGINARNIVLKDASTSEISFKVNKFVDGQEDYLWDKIKNFKLVWCKEWDTWFEIYVEIDQSDVTQKIVTGIRLGVAELSQIMLYGVQINTEDDIAREDYIPTVLFDSFRPEGSLLHRIMKESAQHYTFIHVDESIAKIQRTFTFDGVSIYDAFQQIGEEIGCVFVLHSNSDEYGNILRNISVFDAHSICRSCGHRGDFIDVCPECGSTDCYNSYGEDTTIFITSDDLTDDIQFSSDTDAIKNCLKLEGGDDLMTATIINCNPNGTDTIWRFNSDVTEDMRPELVKKINEYDALYKHYQKDYKVPLTETLVTEYNKLVDKYKSYNPDLEKITLPVVGFPALMTAYYNVIDLIGYLQTSMMPTVEMSEVTAQSQAALLTSGSMSPIAVSNISVVSEATASNAALGMAKAIVDARYQVKVNSSSFSNKTWTGTFKITNYTYKEDTAVSGTITLQLTDDFKKYVEQKIYKTLAKTNDENVSITGLFAQNETGFANELKKYGYDNLKRFANCCQGCLDVMIEQGIADNSTWKTQSQNLYDELYVPYYKKLQAIEKEMTLRQSEIDVLDGIYDTKGGVVKEGLLNQLDDLKTSIQNILDFQKYLGNDLWLEFCAYRRDDKYSNSNFVSTGLSNSEIFNRALEFLELANEELYRSSELQHSISISSLHNLFLIDKFKPLLDHFAIGNWMRVSVDDEIYKLRLVDYEIDYDNIENISVTFSDVIKTSNGLSVVESAITQMQSMSSSYDSVQRQASDGANGSKYIKTWFQDGLDVTNMMIVNNADGQVQTWDEHGMLFRAYDPITESYDEIQMKIINSTLVVTDDDWEHVKTAIGLFYYVDPVDSKVKTAYGINAEMLIGKMIIGENLGLYTDTNSLKFDRNGLQITNGVNTFTVNPNSTHLLNVSGNGDNVFWVDEQGGLHIEGNGSTSVEMVVNSFRLTSGDTIDSIAKDKADQALQDANDYTDNKIGDFAGSVVDPKIAKLQAQLDKQIETYYYNYKPELTNVPANEWRSDEDKLKHDGDLFYDKTTGYVYRFTNEDGTWGWQMIQDQEIKQALQDAATAQDTADHKRRVFVTKPEPPYDVGDLWTQGENGDIKRCNTPKKKGEQYNDADWVLASKYTDDTELKNFVKKEFAETVDMLQDSKAETWYQEEDPSLSWKGDDVKSEHTGDLWYDTKNQTTKIYDGKKWDETKTTPPDAVFDSIDGKAQIFVGTEQNPKPPYSVGDLWFKGAGEDIYTCTKSKTEDERFDDGDWVKYNKYTDDSSLKTFISETYTKQMSDLQKQADKKAETWYQEEDPSLSWKGDDVKSEHTGDLWYDTKTSTTGRWNGEEWIEITANPPEGVFDKIDGKAQIFIEKPKTPYHVGDLWFNPDTEEILTCVNERTEGNFVSDDWKKKNHYIDQAAANAAASDAVNSQTKESIFNKLTNNGQNQGIFTDEKGDFYFNAEYIKAEALSAITANMGTLTAGVIRGKEYTRGTDAHFSSKGIEIDFNNNTIRTPNFAVDSSGAFFKGTITATAGKIGPWTISSNSIHNEGSTVYFGDAGLKLGTGFNVTTAGALTATGASISGTIAASSGKIGPWTISSTSIHNDDSTAYFGSTGLKITDNFSVTSTGALTAKSATITGSITATSGQIGPWTIGDTSIHNSGNTMYFGTSGLKVTDKFNVSNTGVLTATGASINGSIVGTKITANQKYYIYHSGADEDINIVTTFVNTDKTWGDFYGLRMGFTPVNSLGDNCYISFQMADCQPHGDSFTEPLSEMYLVADTVYIGSGGGKNFVAGHIDTKTLAVTDGLVADSLSCGKVGDDSHPVYFNAQGEPKKCTSISGGSSTPPTLTISYINSTGATTQFKYPESTSVSITNASYATTAGSANKLSHTFTVNNVKFDGSSDKSVTISGGGGTTTMKNLTFSGAVSATYNGSAAVNVNIPECSVSYAACAKHLVAQGNTSINVLECTQSAVYPLADGKDIYCGGTEIKNKWKAIRAQTGTIVTSDRRLKDNIKSFSNVQESIYMELNPVSYTFRNVGNDNHDRIHYGFIAQDIEDTLTKYGLTSEECAILCKDCVEDGENGYEKYGISDFVYSLRYPEIVPLNTHMTQKALRHQQEQDKQIEELKSMNEMLLEKLNKLESMMTA